MRDLLLGLMLTAFAAAHAADVLPFGEIAYEDQATGFQFTKMLSAYSFQRKVEYGDPRLGYGVEYVEITGTKASIIVYDLGLQGIQDGTTDPKVLEEFQKIDQGIAGQVQRGGYKSAKRIDDLPPLSKAWLQVNHEILLPDATILRSVSFIRGQNGKFVKIRISGTSQGSYARLPSFLLGVTRAVGMLREKK